jgi:hypothetical protein
MHEHAKTGAGAVAGSAKALLLVLVATVLFGQEPAQAALTPVLSGPIADSMTLPGATSVAVAGHYAYVTDYYAGKLSAFDIINPASPVLVGSSPSSAGLLNASTVNVAGGYAFVVSKNRNGPLGSESNDDGTGDSLTILDISSNPASPAIVGQIHDSNTLFGSYGITVVGHYAYVASQGCLSGQPCTNHAVGCAFAVIDIANPASPTIVAALHSASLPQPWSTTGALGHITAVAISGTTAYLTAAYQSRLTAISIANPLNPKIIASLKDTTNLAFPVDVAISGHYAYVVDQTTLGRLAVVDISNPSNPQIVASLANSALNGAYRIRLHGDFAYISASSGADVAVIDVSNPLSPRLAASVADPAHLNKTTGLDLDASGGYVFASSPFLSNQSQPLYPPYALQPSGPTLTGTISAITLDPTPIAASIVPASEPPNPTAQTAAAFSFSANDAVASLRCQLDGSAFQPCSAPGSQSYAGLGAGAHTFEVQATDAAGNTNVAAYNWTVTPPANTQLPAVSGSVNVGETLTATTGAWTGSSSFAYQWLRCGALGFGCLPIGGAGGSSYTVEGADVGSTLAIQVTATSSAGATSAESPPTPAVAAPPTNAQPPSISGNAVQGETLTASAGSWSGYPTPTLAYQWERCDQAGANCTPIAQATSTGYTLGSLDVAETIRLTVQATNSAGAAATQTPPTAIVAQASTPPANTEAPSISGNAVQDETLTASPGTWSGYPTPTLTYQWERCDQTGANCTPIAQATSTGYTLEPTDVASTIAVTVTATNSAGSTSTTSQPSATVGAPPASTAAPAISGGAVEGQTLTASAGSWSGYPTPTLTYQWERCNPSGQSCAAIVGASSSSYTLLSADVGATLAVTVGASNSYGSAQIRSGTSQVVSSAPGPLTQVLDNFARPDNTGPPGPSWTHMAVSSTALTNDLYVTSQQITGKPGSNADYWNPQTFGPNSEVWLTVAVKPNVDLDPVVLGLRFVNPAAANASGYQAYYIFRSKQADQYKIICRVNGTTSITLSSANGPTLNPGDQLLFRAIGTTLELWRGSAGTWTRILAANDGTYQGAGYLNLTARNSAVRLTGFGGGTLP